MIQRFAGATASRRGWKTLARFLTLGLTLTAGGAALAQDSDPIPEEGEPIPEEKLYREEILEEGEGWQLKHMSGYTLDEKGEYTPYARYVYTLQGAKEVLYTLPLAPSIQEELAVAAEQTEGDTSFLVDKFIADEIAISLEKGEPTEAIKAISEPIEGEPQQVGASSTCSDQLITKSKGFSLNRPVSFSTSFGSGFSGSLSANGNVNGIANGQVEMRVKRHKVFWLCTPYSVQFKQARIWGSMVVSYVAEVSGTVNYGFTWEKEIAKPYLGSVNFMAGPIPVHIGFNLPINLGLEVQASATGMVRYTSNQSPTGSFDYTCTPGSCSGYASYKLSSSSPQPVTGSVSGRIYPTVWVQAALRTYLYHELLAHAQVGLRPYLYGDLWGYHGTTCGDGDGDGINETVSALTFDLDWRLFVNAQVSALGFSSPLWNLWSTTRQHIQFWDVSGSTALRPMLTGPSSVAVNGWASYGSRMRPCWPYGEAMSYRLDWGDGTSTGFSNAPANLTYRSKAWSSTGLKTVSLTASGDAHGRQLNATQSRVVQVQ